MYIHCRVVLHSLILGWLSINMPIVTCGRPMRQPRLINSSASWRAGWRAAAATLCSCDCRSTSRAAPSSASCGQQDCADLEVG